MKDNGKLFVCATPIGNLSDSSFRLIETLKNVDLIITEDTRKTKILLQKFQIQKPSICLEKNNEAERIHLIAQKLSQGQNLALVSEAGTPNISDPGAYLIAKIREMGFEIIPIPGPSAITTILSVSGLLANQFAFLGFFPKKESEAVKEIEKIQDLNLPICYFESGQRILKTLHLLKKILSKKEANAELFIAKELTKIHETFFHGTMADILKKMTTLSSANLKGEWCFIIKIQNQKTVSLKAIEPLKKLQLKNNQILKIATEILGLPKNEVYRYLHVKIKP